MYWLIGLALLRKRPERSCPPLRGGLRSHAAVSVSTRSSSYKTCRRHSSAAHEDGIFPFFEAFRFFSLFPSAALTLHLELLRFTAHLLRLWPHSGRLIVLAFLQVSPLLPLPPPRFNAFSGSDGYPFCSLLFQGGIRSCPPASFEPASNVWPNS